MPVTAVKSTPGAAAILRATGVTGTFATSDALATVTDGSADWGAIGPSAFDDNADNPFEVDIDVGAGNNRDIVFDLVVNAGNGGSACFRFANPS